MVSREVREVAERIRRREIHGSTMAALSAAQALREAITRYRGRDYDRFARFVSENCEHLYASRPSSVILSNLLRHIVSRVRELGASDVGSVKRGILETIDSYVRAVEESVRKIMVIGARRIPDEATIMTHSMSNTVLKIIAQAVSQGKKVNMIVTESRPDFEGRIMASKLLKLGVPVTLIIDSSVRYFMKDVDLVLIGAEAVAANGAVVNKIGTSLVALAANEARVRVYVAAGTYKFSPETMVGMPIKIEYKNPEVVLSDEEREAYGLKNVDVRVPVYDVTPPEYIDLLITEMGVFSPQAAILVLRESYGWPRIEFQRGL